MRMTARPAAPIPRALVVGALAAAAAACSGNTAPRAQCQVDSQCAGGLACVGETCIARATAPTTWAAELEPRADSTAGLTELTSVPAPDASGMLELAAGLKVTVTGTLTSPPNTQALTSAHVVAEVPAAITGRPDLQFAADLAVSVDAAAMGVAPQFALVVPEGALARNATVQVTPVAPQDAAFAPLAFAATLQESLSFTVPALNYTVTGRYFDALRQPQVNFVARAFRDGQLVSTVDVTDNAGAFSLIVPVPTVTSAPNVLFTVELKPMDPTASDPRFTSKPFPLPGSYDLGSLYQAAFTQPNVFRFTIHGDTDSGPPVAGAVVRASTVLAQDTDGATTDFQRDGHTLPNGNADISLLPGTAAAARSYTIAVIPPPESPFGLLCIPSLPLVAGGTADAPANLQPIVAPRRPTVTGVVSDASGHPVAGVVVVATRTAVVSDDACSDDVGSPPGNATTDAAGHFTLLLDPGTYQLDYDPPAGSPAPRLTETGVLVTDNLDHAVQMAVGGLVEGDAVGPDGAALPSAAVRLYEPGPAPLLLAQARTDAKGHFRIVIPLSP